MRSSISSLMVVALAGLVAGGRAEGQDVSTLEQCWAKVEARVGLRACLEGLLSDAGAALGEALEKATSEARELDRVIGPRAQNQVKLAASQAAWRAYVGAECQRRAEAMSPGTGTGDTLLACRVELTRRRAADLARP